MPGLIAALLALGLAWATPVRAESAAVLNAGSARDASAFESGPAAASALRWDELSAEGWSPDPALDAAAPARVVRLPAGSWLRVHAAQARDCLHGVSIQESNGSGLFVEAIPHCSDSGADLLIADPFGQERLIRVVDGRSRSDDPLRLFSSRQERLGLPLAATSLAISAPQLRVATASGQFYRFATLGPGQSGELWLDGPQRLALHTRTHYLPDQRRSSAHCPAIADSAAAQGPPPPGVDHYHLELRFTPEPASTPPTSPQHTRIIEYSTTPAFARPIRIGACAVPSGQLETRYVDVPPGRYRLSVQASTALLLRIDAAAKQAYLLPRLNALRAADPPAPPSTSRRQLLDQAEYLRRDNSQAEGALHAVATLTTAADAAELSSLAEEYRRRHSFYRTLLPDQANPAQSYAYALPQALLPLLNNPEPDALAAAQRDALWEGLRPMLFTALGCTDDADHTACGGTSAQLSFELPERTAPSHLELLADVAQLAQPVSLWLQFDQQPPRRITLAPSPLALPPPEPALRRTHAANRLSDLASNTTSGPTLSRLLLLDEALPWLIPARLVLPLPADIHRLRLWSEAAQPRPLRFALRLGTASGYALSGSAYAQATGALPPGQGLRQFIELLPGSPAEVPAAWYIPIGPGQSHALARIAAQRIREQGASSRLRKTQAVDDSRRWQAEAGPFADQASATAWLNRHSELASGGPPQPARRDVLARIQALRETAPASMTTALAQHWVPSLRLLADRSERYAAAVGPDSTASTREDTPPDQLANARRALRQGDPIGALETLGNPANQTRPEARTQAYQLRITALRSAGEDFMAERLLRGLALHEKPGPLRDWAIDALVSAYTAQADLVALQGLYAALLVREPHQPERHAARLTEVLVAAGETRIALWLGLLLTACEQPLDALLQAAYSEREWAIFDRLLERAAAPQNALWSGYRWQLEGQLQRARQAWEQAGATALLEHLERSIRAARAVADAGGDQRAERLASWTELRHKTPGPLRWEARRSWISAHAGVLSLEVIARDLSIQRFRAEPGRPAVLEFSGPQTLKLEMRPLHHSTAPQDGWIEIRHNGELKLLPFHHNRAAGGLRLVGTTTQQIGLPENSIFEVGPGRHRIEIAARDLALAVQVQALSAALPVAVWPDAAARDQPGERTSSRPVPVAELPVRHCRTALLGPRAHCVSVPAMPAVSSTLEPACPDGRDCGSPNCTSPAPDARLWSPLPGRADRHPPVPAQAPAAHPPVPLEPAELRVALIQAAWRGEQLPAERLAMGSLAEWLLGQHPPHAESAAILSRLRRTLHWERIDSATDSDGFQRLRMDGWQPESQALRLRRALFADLPAGAQILRKNQRLRLALTRFDAAPLTLSLELLELPYASPAGARVQVQFADGRHWLIDLPDAGRPQQHLLPLFPGEHSATLEVVDGYANQLIAVSASLPGQTEALAATVDREFMLSSLERPLRLWVRGPTLIAADHHDEHGVRRRDYRIDAGERVLEIPPWPGQRQSRLRLTRLALNPSLASPAPIRQIPLNWQEAARRPPTATVRAEGPLRLHDVLPLGGQEDGTWSVAARWIERGAAEEEGRLPRTDRYLELATPYYYRSDTRRYALQLEPLLRWRSGEAFTGGLRGGLDWYPSDTAWRLAWRASLFTQHEQGQRWGGQTSAQLSRAWHWSPRWTSRLGAQVFARLLHGPAEPATGLVDNDVFSLYKQTHQQGLRLSSQTAYRPWIDTRLSSRLILTSNDPQRSSDLDSARLDLQWQQLLGPVDAALQARWQTYLADADRERSSHRRSLSLNLGFDRWISLHRRWLANLQWRYEPDLGQHSLRLGLEYSLSRGRLYKDFRAGSIPFAELREREAAGRLNNNQLRFSDHEP